MARLLVPRTPVLVRVLQTLQMSMSGGIAHVSSSQGHPCSCAYFKHSKCPFRRHMARLFVPRTPVLVRVLQTLQLSIRSGLPAHVLHAFPRTPVLARVLQTLQMSIPGGMLHVHCPRTPVLVRVLQTLQLSIIGGNEHVPSSQGHPCSRAYFKHSNCPFMAASCTSLVPRTPVLVRVLQTLQMSILGGTLARLTRSKDTRARARTSNTPNVHSRRPTRTSTRPKDTRARASTSNTPNVLSRRHARSLSP